MSQVQPGESTVQVQPAESTPQVQLGESMVQVQPAESTPQVQPVESFKFQAEINQLMNLIINTFYSNKDIFLRELISNASDAINKVKYDHLRNNIVKDYEIRVSFDKTNHLMTIEDNGVGMDKQGLVSNLGTIASSGTKTFIESLKSDNKKNTDLIGQFGVGFYSSYLVADNVIVITKTENSGAYQWVSAANGEYCISECNNTLFDTHGTKITLHFKEEHVDYLSESRIKEIVKKHNQFISYPIRLYVTKQEEVTEQVTEPAKEKDVVKEESKENDVEVEDDNDDNDDNTKTEKSVKHMVEKSEWEQINTEKSIWTRNPSDVSASEYKEFYKNITGDWNDYLAVKHFSVEGNIEFRGIVYFPKTPPNSMFSNDAKKNNIKLYCRKIFIMDDCKDLVPEWMSFVYGVVDCDDLQLNVSREMLQQNKVMKIIKKQLIKKILEMVEDLISDDDKSKFKTFYETYSKNLKLGVYEDSDNRSKFAKCLRYYSSKSDTDMTSFDSYIERMPENQKEIYYIAGDNLKSVKQSVFLEKLVKNNYEVLFMIENIDEYMMQELKEYSGKKFTSITKDDLKLNEDADDIVNADDLCKRIKKVLGSKVEKVIVSKKLVDSPACLSTGGYGYSANMERIIKAQALNSNPMSQFMSPRKTFEINLTHPVIKKLSDTDDETNFNNIVSVVYDISLMASGFVIDNTSELAKKLFYIVENGCVGKDYYDKDNQEPVEENNQAIDADVNVDDEGDESSHDDSSPDATCHNETSHDATCHDATCHDESCHPAVSDKETKSSHE
jgi:molecular chaperone HtpG